MKFKLTVHAQKRCARRKIKSEWIEVALENFIKTQTDPEDSSLVHVFCPIPEKDFRVLRVIYNETISPVTIVTAYFENEVSKP